MSRSYEDWPEIESIVASFQRGVCIRDLERAYRRNHRQIQDLLYDRGLVDSPGVRLGKPKPAGPGLNLLATCLVLSREVRKKRETPEEMERLIEAVRGYMGGQVSAGTGEYERPLRGGMGRGIELRSRRAEAVSGG